MSDLLSRDPPTSLNTKEYIEREQALNKEYIERKQALNNISLRTKATYFFFGVYATL